MNSIPRNPRTIVRTFVVSVALALLLSATGSAPAVGAGKVSWKTVFFDDFKTSFAQGGWYSSGYTSRWYAYDGLLDTSQHGLYSPTKVLSAANGVLDWYLRTEDGNHLVSAAVPWTTAIASLSSARYQFRFRLQSAPGYKIAFLLWPTSDNWGDGEIDFPEIAELTAGEKIYGAVFSPLANSTVPGAVQKLYSNVEGVGSGWHTATITRVAGSLTYLLDGVQVAQFTENLPTAPMRLVFQVETRIGDAPADDASGHVQLDWVTIQKPA